MMMIMLFFEIHSMLYTFLINEAGQTAREHFAKKKHVFRSAQERDAVLGMFSPIDIPPCQRRTSDIDSEEGTFIMCVSNNCSRMKFHCHRNGDRKTEAEVR